jgi:hypothetical protein
MPKKAPPSGKKEKKGIFSSVHMPSLGLVLARLRPGQKKDNKARAESIDALLDRALTEPPPAKSPATVPPAKTASPGGLPPQGTAPADPFMGLSTAQLEEDLVRGIDLDDPAAGISLPPSAAPATASSVKEPDEVAEILKTSGGDLGDPGSLANADALAADLDSLKDVDLGSLDLGGEPAVAAAPGPAVEKSADPAAPAPSTLPRSQPVLPPLADIPRAEAKPLQLEPLSGGLKGNDDLLSSLKKDMKKVKLGKDPSLVRGMKDTIVQAKDLEGDLSQLLETLKSTGGVSDS